MPDVNPEDIDVKIIAIEEHWNSAAIRDALDRLQGGARDESIAFNTMGDNQARLEDIGQGRIEAMDAAGIDVSILSVVTPATQALPAREAVALARDANDEAAAAVRAHPARFRAFATLPTSDSQAAAAAELERCATQLGHVGAMVHGRTGTRTLDDPAYDDLFATAASLHQPIFIHPQIPSNELRDAAYRGLDPLLDLGLATFGWGWHMDAGLSALRLILRGTFDRYPGLQLVLGHWGEMLLFWMDRADSLSGIAKHLERRVSGYITTNVTSQAAECCRSACCATPSTSPAPARCCSPPTTPSTNPAERRSDTSSTPSPTRRTAPRSPPATRKLCST
jgi:predicted TIM-barrel fold metal-dependent hydrolase